jgi:hypothetical protein
LSKEIGVVVLLGFGLGWLLALIVESVRNHESRSFIQRIMYNRTFIWGLILSAMSFIALRFTIPQWGESGEVFESALQAGLHSFNINMDSILMKLKEMFLLNFSWVFVLFCLLAVIVVSWKRLSSKQGYPITKHKLNKHVATTKPKNYTAETSVGFYQNLTIYDFLPIIGSYVAFVIFNMTYLTYLFPRYISFHVVCLTLAAVCAIVFLFERKHTLLFSATAFITMLLLVQNFYTIDPVTLRTFKKIDIGGTDIVTARVFYLTKDEGLTTDPWLVSSLELTNAVIYNRQYCYLGTAFEHMLSDIEYDAHTMLLIDPVYGRFGTYVSIFGKRQLDADVYYFDPLTGRVFQESGPQQLNIRVVEPNEHIDITQYDGFERIYFITFPYRQGFDQNAPLEGVQVLSEGVAEYRFWEIQYSRLK